MSPSSYSSDVPRAVSASFPPTTFSFTALAAAPRDRERRAVEHGAKGHEGRVGGERVLLADADDGGVLHLTLMRDDGGALVARGARRDQRHVEAARGEHAPREAAGEACKLAAEVVIELEDDSLHRCRFKLVRSSRTKRAASKRTPEGEAPLLKV